jgi:ring-1,2-phenylacetyl-CoA epoxidase subunit PaaE
MEFIQWKIIQVIPETADAKTYVLEETEGKKISWEAGQFLTFLFYDFARRPRAAESFSEGEVADEHEIRRSYSISTVPGIDKHIAITVKKKVNGEISRHILSHWKTGTIVSSLPPAGRFTIQTDAANKRHVFCIAAGSGIVPIFGLIKKLLYQEPGSQITLLYQNTHERNIIYDQSLQQLAALFPQRLHRIDLLSNPISPDAKPVRLNNWLLEQLLTTNLPTGQAGYKPQTANPLFFTCGPESFMRMVQFTLRLMGVSEDQLRKEHFVIDPPRKPAFTMKPIPHSVVLHFQNKRYEFTSAFPHTILKAAQQNGITLPFSCNAGRCATCVAKCQKGTVKMSNNEVLTDKDVQSGLILTCVGYAATDIELEM